MPSSSNESRTCARRVRDDAGASRPAVSGCLLAAQIVLLAAALSGCGREAEQSGQPKPPEQARPFDEIIADAQCLSCHSSGNRMGVPSWKEVAAKYKKDKADRVEARLAHKIVHGGSGAWGRVNMPPHPELRGAELKVVVRGIMASGDAKAKSAAPAQKK